MNYIEKEFFKFSKANQLKFIFQADGLTYKADFYSKKFNLIVNINGCFWHNHGCINSKIPKKNTRYWLSLFEKNKTRDYANTIKLKSLGYNIINIWECVLMDKKARNDLYFNINKLIKNLNND